MQTTLLFCVLCLSYLATKTIAQNEVPCQVSKDCENIPGSTCKDDRCQCSENTPVLINKTESVKCVEAAFLKENCTYDEQCPHNNTVCSENKCKCEEGFEEKSGNCMKIEKGGKSDETPKSWRKYVPMIFGIAITFFIILTLSIYVYRLRKRRKRAKAAAASLEMMTNSKNRLSSL